MKTLELGKISTVVFGLVCVLFMTVESVYALPVLTFFFFITQLPLFSYREQVVLAVCCGSILSILYSVPLIIGMTLLSFLAAVHQLEWGKARIEVRNIFLVLMACGVLFIMHNRSLEVWSVIRFMIYLAVIMSGMRIINRRRLQLLRK